MGMDVHDEYFLKSERLEFRHWREDDLPLAISLWGDPEVIRFVDVRSKLTDAEVKEIFEKYLALDRESAISYWPIFLRSDGEFVGCCGLRPHGDEKDIYETGFYIRSRYWRQGFAEEAACAVIRYAFEILRVKALKAGHNPKNAGSRRILEKLGFVYLRDEFYAPTGMEHPKYILERPAIFTPGEGL